MLPPDFLFHKVKSVYPVGTKVNDNNLKYTGEESSYVVYTAEMQREDLYRTIGVGIGGAAMPGWKGVFQDDEHGTGEEKLWGLVYYVQSLIELRNTKEGWELRQKLLAQAAPETPAAPEPEGGAQGGQR